MGKVSIQICLFSSCSAIFCINYFYSKSSYIDICFLGVKTVKFVSINSLPVYHWDKCVRKYISLDRAVTGGDDMDFSVFLLNKVLESFEEEIGKSSFRLYSMPFDYDNVEQRNHLKTSDEVCAFIDVYFSAIQDGNHPPSLFVFNYEDSSPKKLPAKNMDRTSSESEVSKSSKSSNESRFASDMCRQRDMNTCVFCHHIDHAVKDTCHLYELKTYEQLAPEAKIDKLLELSIDNINSVSNMLSLCDRCHQNFDTKYLLGIHPEELTLIVSTDIRGSSNVTQGGIHYIDLHGKKIEFNNESRRLYPPLVLLKYRFTLFESKLELGTAGRYYCPHCPMLFGSDEELRLHLPCVNTVTSKSSERKIQESKSSTGSSDIDNSLQQPVTKKSKVAEAPPQKSVKVAAAATKETDRRSW